MNIEIGTTGIITFGNNTTSKVTVVDKQTYPATGMPTDYFFSYQDDEKNRPLTHPNFEDKFPIPEDLAKLIFKKD